MSNPAAKERKISPEASVAIVLAVVLWIFSAGILWQKVDDLEKKVDLIERLILKPNPQISQER